MQASLVRGDATDVTLSEAKILLFLPLQYHKSEMFRFALLDLTITRLNPKRPIKGPVLDRFAHVLWRNVALAVEVGDCTRDL